MLKIIKQIKRGCGTLPYYGEHPGTMVCILLILVGAVAGAQDGLKPALVGMLITAVFVLPMYFMGAYYRAKDSDELVSQNLDSNPFNIKS
jgi:threonine/homoserine efflux transporter RhtA